jgi:EAL domain-containing protein (putative c-di-GMP-specific phosphodiesterase class I)
MMKEFWPFLAAFGVAVAGAVGALAYALGGGPETTLALGAAIGCAILGQLMLMALGLRQDERRDGALRRVTRDVAGFHSEIRRKTEGFQAQVDVLRQQGEQQSAAVIKGINELQSSYGSLQSMLEARVANMAAAAVRPEPVIEPAPQFEPPPEDDMQVEADVEQEEPQAASPPLRQPEPIDDAFADQITFALEPVVDILTRRTAHYRMHLTMSFGGDELSNDRLLHYAGRMGKRPMLDLLAAREAVELLAKLRQRDPDLCLFVNIGAETLSDDAALSSLMDLRQEAGALASGIIFEMPHAMLAGLPEQALEGLAGLARSGAAFALGQVSVSGLDLQSMNVLNVRHVQLSAGAIDPAGPSTSLIGFAQMARLSRINLIVTGVSEGQLVPKLQNIARLACGPCFATPRRVKRKYSTHDSMGLAA